MAITYVQENYVNTAVGGGASITLTLTTALAAGNHAIVLFSGGASTSQSISTTAPGATAQLDVPAGSGVANQVSIASIYAPSGINNSTHTITITTTAGAMRGVLVEEFSGLATVLWLDKTATSGPTTALAMTAGPTATTSQAAEVAVGAWCVGNTLVTPFAKDAAYSLFTTGTGGFSTATKQAFAEYLILAATGAQTATATEAGSTARGWTGAIATYKAAAANLPDVNYVAQVWP